jgi:hypothetical protein
VELIVATKEMLTAVLNNVSIVSIIYIYDGNAPTLENSNLQPMFPLFPRKYIIYPPPYEGFLSFSGQVYKETKENEKK